MINTHLLHPLQLAVPPLTSIRIGQVKYLEWERERYLLAINSGGTHIATRHSLILVGWAHGLGWVLGLHRAVPPPAQGHIPALCFDENFMSQLQVPSVLRISVHKRVDPGWERKKCQGVHNVKQMRCGQPVSRGTP